VKDDLYLDVFVPYADHMAEDAGDIFVEGIDGATITVGIPYPADKNLTEGKVVVKGDGMPFRRGRGDLVVTYVFLFNALPALNLNGFRSRWQVIYPSPTPKWKKVLHMPCG
jgi:hypothetical protein